MNCLADEDTYGKEAKRASDYPFFETEAAEKYEFRKLLGSGGDAKVFLVYDRALELEVALKHVRGVWDARAVSRFLREVSYLQQAKTSFVPRVLGVGYQQGEYSILRRGNIFNLHFTMPYQQGRTLHEIIYDEEQEGFLQENVRNEGEEARKRRLDLYDSLTHVLVALKEAHEKKVVHRDIKPRNIYRTDTGKGVVLDWGALGCDWPSFEVMFNEEGCWKAKSFQRTQSNADVFFSPIYAAPEIQRREDPQCCDRSDIFSFGICLFELIAGVHPFEEYFSRDTKYAIQNEQPSAHLISHAGVSMVDFIFSCLEKDANNRPTAMQAEEWLKGEYSQLC